jgi:hypothetical protein
MGSPLKSYDEKWSSNGIKHFNVAIYAAWRSNAKRLFPSYAE